MIRGDQARGNKGRKVTYQTVSGERPWLKNAREIRLTGSANAHSAEVEYTDSYGLKDTAWVGFASLTLAESPYQVTIDALNKQKSDLLTQVAALDAAIKTLENLA